MLPTLPSRARARRAAPSRRLLLCTLTLTLALAACNAPPGGTDVRVVTRSLGSVFSLDSLAGQAGDPLARVAARQYARALETDPLGRAAYVAAEIAAARPDVVALQDVALFRTQSPSDYRAGVTEPNASRVALDPLAALLDTLAARGVPYAVAAEATTLDAEYAASPNGVTFFDVRVTLRELVLVRADLDAAPLDASGAFGAATAVRIDGRDVVVRGGMAAAEVRLGDRVVTAASARFGPGAAREAQAREAAERLGRRPAPVLLAGLLAPSGTPAYAALAGDYVDAWAFLRPGDPGLTCCHPPGLTEAQGLSERSTLVLARGDVLFLDAERLGVRAGQRTRSGRWPAPHGGLAARARVRAAE